MQKMKYSFLIILTLIFISTSLLGQRTQIDKLVKKTFKKNEVPAIAIGVFQKDSILFTEGYGQVLQNVPTTIRVVLL